MRKETKKDFEKAIQETNSMQAAARQLNMSYVVFRDKVQKFELFKPNPSGKGTSKPRHYKCKEDVFKMFNFDVGRDVVKRWLLREREYKCEGENCGINIWNNKPITLELEHINGNRRDNRLENLKILCPNCHSQTITFRKKKVK